MSYRAFSPNKLQGGYQPLPYYPALGVTADVSASGQLDVQVGNQAADAGVDHLEQKGVSKDSVKEAVEISAKVAAGAACAAVTGGLGTVACGLVADVVMDFLFDTIVPAIGDLFSPDKEEWQKYRKRQAEVAAFFGTQQKITEAQGQVYEAWNDAIYDLRLAYCRLSGGKKPTYTWLATALKNAGAMMEDNPTVMCLLDVHNRPPSGTDTGYKFTCGVKIAANRACGDREELGPVMFDLNVPGTSGLCVPQFDVRWYQFGCVPSNPTYAKCGGTPSWCKPNATSAEWTAYGQNTIVPQITQYFDRLSAARGAVSVQIASMFAADVAMREAQKQKAAQRKPPPLMPAGSKPTPRTKAASAGKFPWGMTLLVGGGAVGVYLIARRPRVAAG